MIETLRAAKRQNWNAAGNWLLYTVAFGALPFWGLALILWLSASAVTSDEFVKEARLAVYAAGLLAASIPSMQKEIADSPYKHPKWFLAATIFVIVAAALLFGGATIDPDRFDMARLTLLSTILTASALALGFLTELVNDVRSDPNLWADGEKQVEDLARQVRRKREKSAP